MKELLAAAEVLGLKLGLATPAFFGGLLALHFYDEPPRPGDCDRCRKVLVVLTGWGLGYFCSPLIVEAFSLTDSKGRLEVGFAVLIAAGGMALLAALLRAVRSVEWAKIIESWTTRR